mmetsp:Transcript_19731/g.45413  ORF Transcript_19731/g.45413 Transcript_19731/m.45413 type:complete len:267 (-) Transcript_19731:39-839(-)
MRRCRSPEMRPRGRRPFLAPSTRSLDGVWASRRREGGADSKRLPSSYSAGDHAFSRSSSACASSEMPCVVRYWRSCSRCCSLSSPGARTACRIDAYRARHSSPTCSLFDAACGDECLRTTSSETAARTAAAINGDESISSEICCLRHTRQVVCVFVSTCATPSTGPSRTMPLDKPMSPMNWCSCSAWHCLPPLYTSAPPRTMRKSEFDGWPSSCSTVPLRNVVHVPTCSSLSKSTAERACAPNTARQRSTACLGSDSACLRLERIE